MGRDGERLGCYLPDVRQCRYVVRQNIPLLVVTLMSCFCSVLVVFYARPIALSHRIDHYKGEAGAYDPS